MVLIKTILDQISHLNYEGNQDAFISEVIPIKQGVFTENSLAWCGDRFRDFLLSVEVGTLIIGQATFDHVRENHPHFKAINWLVVENPRRTFSQILHTFFVSKKAVGIIAPSAVIDPSVVVDVATSYIGNNVVIEANCVVGKGLYINHNSVIMKGTIIEDNVTIGSNCTIGGTGFGYELDANDEYQLIPHIGNVHLSNNVEIADNVCIDRAVLGSTTLGENVKVDNLAHISHGVQIGRNSLIIAQAMVAGSVTIGENVWVAPSTSIIQKVNIGDNAIIGLGSTVIRDVESNSVVAGVPAKKIRDK